VALRRPTFGFFTFVWLGFFNPHSMTWGPARTLPFAQVVALCTIVGYFLSSTPKKIPFTRESVLLFLLWLMFGVSTIFSIYPQWAFNKFTLVSKILLMVFLCMSLIDSKEKLHLLLRVIALSLGFYGLKGGVWIIITGGAELVWGPEDSFLYANNAIGLALAMNIPLLVYLLKIERQKWLRLIIKAMLVFSYPAILGTYSRGAWLGLGLVTAFIVLKSQRKFFLTAVAGTLAVTMLPIIVAFLPARMTTRYDTLVNYEQDASAESRFWNWEFCKRVGLENPLTGGGFDFNSTELYAVYYPEFIERWGAGKVWSCHSVWFTIFGEHGVPGLLLWIGLMASCFLSLRHIRTYGERYPELSWASSCAKMLQGALIAFMIVGTFLDAAYFDMLYYLIATIVIIKGQLRFGPLEVSVRGLAAGIRRPLLPSRVA
jgi:putative inorganic carbon (HCO3(-)) transporter